MPVPPRASRIAAEIRGSVFSSLGHRLATHPGEVYPLHVGDTWLEPPPGCRMEELRSEAGSELHRYAPPAGLPRLIDALVERHQNRGERVDRDQVLVAAGATGALAAVMGALLEPQEEVLILAPYWPLIEGIVRSFRGVPVVVPFLGEVHSALEAREAVAAKTSNRTAVLYISSPNNPTGKVIPPAWIEGLVEWARERNLWVVSDEVYEDYVYEGKALACRPLAPERSFSVHSFSKAFGMAGYRCGYVTGPATVMPAVAKLATHTFYSTPTPAQVAAQRALEPAGQGWLEEARKRYREIGNRAADRLKVARPEGGTFLFIDVSRALDGEDLSGFLERCADEGVFLAPGPSFGPYPAHVRLCFTAALPEVTLRGVERLASLLEGSAS